jgi:hypothetical protein
MSEARKTDDQDDGFEIEVVDDMPEEDRGRPIAPEVTESDDDITLTEEEISKYREESRQKVRELAFKAHSERRAKELAARERDEVIQLANRLAEENKKYRELAGSSEQFAVNQAKTRAESEINATKRAMKEAFEGGETDKFIEHQERLQRLVNEHERYSAYKPEPIPEPQRLESPKRQGPDPEAVKWAKNNPWFEGGSELEKEMTGYACAVSDILIRDKRIDPTSDQYFDEINKRVQKRFPEYFKSPEPEIDVTAKASTVVAPASRTTKTVSKVRLTPTQVSLARRFGLTPEQYVAQYMKDHGSNGRPNPPRP